MGSESAHMLGLVSPELQLKFQSPALTFEELSQLMDDYVEWGQQCIANKMKHVYDYIFCAELLRQVILWAEAGQHQMLMMIVSSHAFFECHMLCWHSIGYSIAEVGRILFTELLAKECASDPTNNMDIVGVSIYMQKYNHIHLAATYNCAGVYV